jgi:hypothetical protein
LSRLPGKRARPVLRGPRRSNAPGLLDERWFAELTTKLLQRGVHTSVQALEADIRAWIETWNQDPKPFVWTKTADEILGSLARYCQRISGAGH